MFTRYGKLSALCIVNNIMEKEGPVISTLNSRRLFMVMIVILALALVACERPLQEEATPTATAPAEGPAEQQPEAGGETGVDAPPTLVPTEAAQPAEGSGEQPAEQPAQPADEPAQPADEPAQPAEQPAQPAEQPAQPPEESTVPTVEVTVAPSGEQVVTVQAGQNLFRIGLQFGCTVPELAAYNGIVNPHYIYVGQQIRIPATCGG